METGETKSAQTTGATKKSSLKQLAVTIIVLVALNFAGNYFFKRFDLTHDKRYTLSQASLNVIDEAVEPIYVEVFLAGDVTDNYKRLQDETSQLLEEFRAYSPNIKFSFFNPIGEGESEAAKRDLIYNIYVMDNPQFAAKEKEIKQSISQITNTDEAVMEGFVRANMQPASVSVIDKGKQSETVIFPWAIVTSNGRSVKIPLLKNQRGASAQENIETSVQNLEYAFADGFKKVIKEKEKKIVVLRGNGEMQDRNLSSFLRQLGSSYLMAPFTLDSVSKNPQNTLKLLKEYDLAIIAKPREKFTEEEKMVIDQYIVNGGKTLWMVDPVEAEMDSLTTTGTAPAMARDLNLNDMFFKYGVRLPPVLVKDEMATPIKLATGDEGSGTQYNQYLWKFAPFIYPDSINASPIVKNLGGIKLDFAGGIDTLKNGIKKNILLATSRYSATVGTPTLVTLDAVNEEFDPKQYAKPGFIPVAVLLEGNFRSMYENRVLPFKDPSYKVTGKPGKMIVISDGDIAKNQFDSQGNPLELGFDKWTGEMYDNRDFMMNCVNYLLDDTGLINIRSKSVSLPMLNTQKVHDEYASAQLITVGIPLALLLVFAILFTWLRKRKYAK
ncbi:gliding motility-associated ABC transporter substrate-binding protein GldG [uncultured Flavobacterium sp.]|uniref:gliding motility-associated ABC transporter substrate-binding protein GldG n=1 Tax=uncultured Flavobacterium sp. TaxID=165435 RepID=UPI0025CE5FB6|nr:gliding motility-associated ABC transporter substrate-binding protein GldG [uncultured Flavobacterium sp.]